MKKTVNCQKNTQFHTNMAFGALQIVCRCAASVPRVSNNITSCLKHLCMDSSTIHRPLGHFIRGKNSLLIICNKNEKIMTPAIFRQHKSFSNGNINVMSNGGGLIPIIETGSYGRPQGHINCLRVPTCGVLETGNHVLLQCPRTELVWDHAISLARAAVCVLPPLSGGGWG
jgi:hypothetical protein